MTQILKKILKSLGPILGIPDTINIDGPHFKSEHF